MSPDFRELCTEIELMFPDFAESDLVVEVRVEEAHMIVCALRAFSVFSTCVVAKLPDREVMAEPLKEVLQVWLIKAAVFGQVGIVVRQRKETVLLV